MFSWKELYLTSELSERVRYRGYYMPAHGYEFYLRVEHEKINFTSTTGQVIFCLLYKHQ